METANPTESSEVSKIILNHQRITVQCPYGCSALPFTFDKLKQHEKYCQIFNDRLLDKLLTVEEKKAKRD